MSFSSRRTKIVCTLGPASNSPEIIGQLIDAGMDVARLNFSHGNHEQHAKMIRIVREQSEQMKKPVAILQDLQGPKIRTGELENHQPVVLIDGAAFSITTRPIAGTAAGVSTTYAALPNDVKHGDRILISDGLLELRVVACEENEITCTIVHGGVLKEHQGINLPGVAVTATALTDKDRQDIDFGVMQKVDYIALSFVRKAEDIVEAKSVIAAAQSRLTPGASTIPLIAKLEKPEAIEHLDAILAAADGVMVARGDLGVEIPLEQVPLIQKRIIKKANEREIPVITATQMLESMIVNPRPTRAEVSDVANAIMDGTDAIMLSGETAAGKFPVETVRTMAQIAHEVDSSWHIPHTINERARTSAQSICDAARVLADQTEARIIVVFTRSGTSARLISKTRPQVPIIALCPEGDILHRLPLWWGVTPMSANLMETTEALIVWVDLFLQVQGYVQPGDYIVILGGMPVARKAKTNFVKLHRIGDA